MYIYLAADHAGFHLKEAIKTYLMSQDYEVYDMGAHQYDPDDDFPDFVGLVAREVSEDPDDAIGFIFGGSGQGEAMAANRFPDVRAIVFYGTKTPLVARDALGTMSTDPLDIVRLGREHNDANVLSFGARFITEVEARNAVDCFLQTQFSGRERYDVRNKALDELA